MQGMDSIGKLLVIVGIVIVIMGGLFWLASRLFGGNIPGTIKIQTSGLTCVIPLLASIVISLVLTLVLNIVARFLNR